MPERTTGTVGLMGSRKAKTDGTRAGLALGLFATSMVVTAVAAAFHVSAEAGPTADQWGLPGFEGVLAVVTALVGYLIARRTSNPTGWIYSGIGVGSSLQYLTEQYATAVLILGSDLPAGATVAWVAEWVWIPLVASIALLLLVFPDDRIESRPGRSIAAVLAAGTLGSFLVAAFLSPRVTTWDVANPYSLGVDRELADSALGMAAMVIMLAMVAAAIRLVARLRRATGVRRQQLKWFAYAAVYASISMVFGAIPATSAVGSKFAVVGIIAIAVASAIAVLKYRLYDIDVVINRTLVYVILTAILAGAYIGTVFALQALLAPFAAQSDLAIAGSTLAVAALFRPARHRVQDFIDRRFYRRKFDAEQTLQDFSARLRDEVDLGAVSAQLAGAVRQTLEPAHLSIWMKRAAGADR